VTLVRAADHDPTFARADWSRWIADCPNPYCSSALMLSRFEPFFQCWDCGARSEITWPTERMVYEIERLLTMRPFEKDRCWNPGETLQDLMGQNVVLGCFEPHKQLAAETGPGKTLFAIDNDGIRTDWLPVAAMQELKAIGA
jgi:hypothetical protein